MSYSATRFHDISCGHRVLGHEGKCAHLHGHNYRIHFTIEPKRGLDMVGRVLDFSAIKSHLCEWLEKNLDHKMVLWEQDPMVEYLEQLDVDGLVVVPFNPTAEGFAEYLVNVIGPRHLPSDVVLVEVRVEETAKCSATFRLEKEV